MRGRTTSRVNLLDPHTPETWVALSRRAVPTDPDSSSKCTAQNSTRREKQLWWRRIAQHSVAPDARWPPAALILFFGTRWEICLATVFLCKGKHRGTRYYQRRYVIRALNTSQRKHKKHDMRHQRAEVREFLKRDGAMLFTLIRGKRLMLVPLRAVSAPGCFRRFNLGVVFG